MSIENCMSFIQNMCCASVGKDKEHAVVRAETCSAAQAKLLLCRSFFELDGDGLTVDNDFRLSG